MKYINADELMEIIKTHHYMLANAINSRDYGMFTTGIEQAINETESVEVVRCKDCKFRDGWNECARILPYNETLYVEDDFFCKYGKRKETDDK